MLRRRLCFVFSDRLQLAYAVVLSPIGEGKGGTQVRIQDVLADDYDLASSIAVPSTDRWWTKTGIETH